MAKLSRIIATFLETGARVALWPVRVAAARAALAQLAAMDARELADIGLTGQDLRDATASPLDQDATGMLAARREEARRHAAERRAPPSPGAKRPIIRRRARTGS